MKKRTITAVVLVVLALVIDQCIKIWFKTNLFVGDEIVVFEWFRLHYTENSGMAFGMTPASTWILTLFRLVAVGAFCWYIARCIRQMRPLGLIACLALIIAGATGNIIDNVFYDVAFEHGEWLQGKVVDMFYFPLWTWPEWMPVVGGGVFFGAIFNFADACISCGAVALVIFYYRFISGSSSETPQAKDTPAE